LTQIEGGAGSLQPFCHLELGIAMNFRVLSISLFILAFSAVANAQTWTSPDGFLSVTPPDATQFQAIPPEEPFVASWVSNDDSMKLGVLQVEIPPGVNLNQSAVEEGFAKEVGGPATRLPTKRVSGHEVWHMTAKGPAAEVTQSLIHHDDTLSKLIAVTFGDNPDAESINRFFDSLSIAQPASPPLSGQPHRNPAKENGGGLDLHSLSKSIGGFGALLGIGLLVYLVTRGKKN